MPSPSVIAVLDSGDYYLRHGFVLRPHPDAKTFIAVTITSYPDEQCTAFETNCRRHAYFHHYLQPFVEKEIYRLFPQAVPLRASYSEIIALETDSHDQPDEQAHF